ncbi:phage holin family protein [Patescibacteria group bacterium]|nr:phage holin family protein [Patescibacteria group bacterium]
MKLLINWLILTLAVLGTSYILPGVSIGGFWAALITALVLGVVNAFIKPILLFLTLPINILTLGLFTFVINALLILLVSAIVSGFSVANFWWALLFSIVITVLVYILNKIVK